MDGRRLPATPMRPSESMKREAHEGFEFVKSDVGIDNLDGLHTEGPGGLEVDAQVIEEHGLPGFDVELLERQLVEAGVGLAHTGAAGLHDHVEHLQHLLVPEERL